MSRFAFLKPTIVGTIQAATNAGDGSTAVVIPPGTELLVLNGSHWDFSEGDIYETLTLAGRNFTVVLQTGDGDLGSNTGGTLVAYLLNPPAGSHTLAWTWTSNDAKFQGGTLAGLCFRDVDEQDPVPAAHARSAAFDASPTAASLDVSIPDDLHLSICYAQTSGADPSPVAPILETHIDSAVNSHNYDVVTVLHRQSIQNVTISNDNYGTMMSYAVAPKMIRLRGPVGGVVAQDIAAAGTLSVTGAAALSATGDIDGAGSVSITGSADLSASADMVAAGTLAITGTADLDALAEVVASGTLSITGSADLAAPGNVVASGSISVTGAADLNGSAEVIAAGSLSITGLASLTGNVNSIVASGTLAIDGSAAPSATGALDAAGSLAIDGSADLASTGDLEAAGSMSIIGSATISGIAQDIVASGSLVVTGAADLDAIGALLAAGSISMVGVAGISSSLDAIIVREVQGVAGTFDAGKDSSGTFSYSKPVTGRGDNS